MMNTTRLSAFRQAAEKVGLALPIDLVPGRIVRFAGVGKSNGNKSGWAWISEDGQGGAFGDWASGVSESWHTQYDREISAAERAEQARRVHELRRIREEQERLRQADGAQRASAIWEQAIPAAEDHPYLQKKGIQHHGLRVDDEQRLIVPVMADGTLSSLQFIDRSGEKLFLPGGKARGGSFAFAALNDPDTLLLCEGFATGASLYEATHFPVVAAFSAGNLTPVAEQLRQQFPTARLLVCGDNDLSGTGQRATREAADAVNGLTVIPEETGKDWNDVWTHDGCEAVREAIIAVIRREETRTMETERLMDATPEKVATEPLARYQHLLEGPDPVPAPRLPQDYREGRLSIGVMIEGEAYVICSNREILSCKEFGAVNHGLTNVRFSKEGIKRFLQGEAMNGVALMERLEAFSRRFVMMGEDLPALLAVWLIGTYSYMAFEYFPYLVLRSPEKRCGKSRTLDLISLLGFNAHQPTASPTEAQIFREPREDGGVQIYDELEGMTGDKERWGAVTSVFNVGFHRGSVVSRYRKTGQGQQKETFDTYGPRAIASISSLEATLEDRSIMVMMQRLLPGQQTERFSLRKLDHEAQRLRDDLYIFALTTAPTIAELYDGAEFAGLQGLDHRAVDLWEPVLSIAAVVDASGTSSNLTNRMVRLAERLGGDRNARSGDETIPAIIETLNDYLLIGSEARISTKDLVEKVRLRLGWETLTPKALANRLHPLGLRTDRWREGGDLRRGYIVKRDQIDDLVRRYTPETCGTWHK